MRRTSTLIWTTVTVLLLAACTGDGADGTGVDGTGADGTGTAGPSDATTADRVDGPLVPATAECLVGTWQLDLPALQDDLRRTVGDGVEVVVAGSSTYEFAEGGAFAAQVDSSSSMVMSADGTELTSTTTSRGDLAGAWSLEGDLLTISDVDTRGLDVRTEATMDGEDLDVPPASPQDSIEAMPPTSSTASCGDTRATLAMPLQQDEGSDPVTITYTLRR